MNGDYLNKILAIDALHALYREDGRWYHQLKRFPGVLFDKNGYVIFPTQEEYLNHPKLKRRKDLNVRGGISSFSNYNVFNAFQKLLAYGIANETLKETSTNEETIRVLREIDIILRKKKLAERIKKLYKNSCQLCGVRISIRKGKYYSEVHHIVSLGRPHNGQDHTSNMICVCPNCHVQLDLKAIALDTKKFKALEHDISPLYINYHNDEVQKMNL